MQIFLSHHNRQKPLIREIRRNLPEYLGAWIDEQKLIFGDNIATSIETTIKSDMDYLLLFLDENAANSEWVRREIAWTLQAEKEHGRTILLPVVIDDSALVSLGNVELQNRKHLRLKDFLETSVRSLAENIASELFALVCRDMNRLRNPKPKTATETLADADSLIRRQAALIQKAIFPHRRNNPISRDTLRDVINAQGGLATTPEEFEALLASVVRRNLIPGLLYDGFDLFLIEEHASWKAEVQKAKKERIGRKAASLIENNMKVLFDAGSTIEEVVRIICKKIESHALKQLTVATTSINIADMISDCCVSMGFDDDFSAVRLYVPGGKIRPSTQAIIAEDAEPGQIRRLAERLGGFDLAVVGVNGIDSSMGFTTHSSAEVRNKRDVIQASRTRLIVGDSSKVGIVLECQFASFSDELQLVIDDDANHARLQELVGRCSSKIILA